MALVSKSPEDYEAEKQKLLQHVKELKEKVASLQKRNEQLEERNVELEKYRKELTEKLESPDTGEEMFHNGMSEK